MFCTFLGRFPRCAHDILLDLDENCLAGCIPVSPYRRCSTPLGAALICDAFRTTPIVICMVDISVVF